MKPKGRISVGSTNALNGRLSSDADLAHRPRPMDGIEIATSLPRLQCSVGASASVLLFFFKARVDPDIVSLAEASVTSLCELEIAVQCPLAKQIRGSQDGSWVGVLGIARV